MTQPEFLRYIGDPDFHDGTILDVADVPTVAEYPNPSAGNRVVRVRGASGRIFNIEFHDVRAVRSCRPVGMLIYSLSELRCDPPYRRFVFANWNEDGEACLEIEARECAIVSPE